MTGFQQGFGTPAALILPSPVALCWALDPHPRPQPQEQLTTQPMHCNPCMASVPSERLQVCGLLFAAQLPADDGQHRSHLNLGWQLSRRLKVEQCSIRLLRNSLAGSKAQTTAEWRQFHVSTRQAGSVRCCSSAGGWRLSRAALASLATAWQVAGTDSSTLARGNTSEIF
jgi:hypothetical protein